ncbi:MAG: hypothetical protein RLZZ306_1711 [Bacteroidota bacterium]|jgi:hypothetical protein
MYTKKLLFSLCLLAFSFIAHTQILEKGTWLTGGSLTYLNISQKNSFTNTSESNGAFIGGLSLANMVTSDLAIGVKASYFNSSNVGFGNIGPSLRYFFRNEKPSKVFLLGDVGFNIGSSAFTNNSNTGYSVGLGLANFLSNYVSVDITGTYGNTFSNSGIQQSGSGNTSIGVIALQVGLQIYLPKKKI